MTNPYVFIVGCPRSGTTLLRRMVDAHPLVAITREQHWLPKWFELRKGLTPEGLVTPKLISELLGYEKFSRMQIGRKELERLIESDGPVEYPDFVTGVFNLYGQRQGKPLVGDKTPAYTRSIPTLHHLWPHGRFVHIIRDGRDICLSVINWERASKPSHRFTTWDKYKVTTVAHWWEWHVRLGREAGEQLRPELYHEVRYESLVSDPTRECERLCEFLSIPYDDAMIRFHEGKTRIKPGRSAKKAWQPVTPGLRKWQSQMPSEDVERFEAVAGGFLEELGYHRAFPSPSLAALELASKVRDSFTQDLRAHGQRLPEGW